MPEDKKKRRNVGLVFLNFQAETQGLVVLLALRVWVALLLPSRGLGLLMRVEGPSHSYLLLLISARLRW